tara:strand:+ start:258 stop:410 length:153 start_codon:yes stop_codon:yes gene_type:complete
MEFVYYMVACAGIMALAAPLFSIAQSLSVLASTVETDVADEPVRARVRTK